MKKLVVIGGLFLSNFLTAFAFTDVDDTRPYSEAILKFENEGRIQGYQDGSFKPDKTISRAEFLKVLFEANSSLEAEEKTNCFPDVREEWFAKYVCTAKEKGIVNGTGDGLFHPNDEIIFAEVAKIMFETSNNSNYSFFQEKEDPWYKEYVNALSYEKIIAPTITNIDYKITRGEMVEMAWRDEYKSLYHREYDSYKRSTVFAFRDDGTHYVMMDVGYPYLWKDGFVWYEGTQMPEVDFESFVQLKNGYARDKNTLYYQGISLPLVDTDTFEHIGKSQYSDGWEYSFVYLKDANSVYVIDTKLSRINQIKEAMPQTFEVLNHGYAHDASSVFYKTKKMAHVKPSDFSLLSVGNNEKRYMTDPQYYYADGTKVYLFGNPLEELDLATFETVCRNIVRDKNAVYQVTVEGVDTVTLDTENFTCFGFPWTYIKDQQTVWLMTKEELQIIEGADAISFETFGTHSSLFSFEVLNHSGRDKNFGYYIGRKIEGSDGKTFQHWRDFIFYDKNALYVRDEKIDFIDRASFNPLEGFYLKDKNNVHYYNKFTKLYPLEKVEGADVSTFEDLTLEYGRDKFSGFYRGKKILESDGETFEVIDEKYSKDKNHVYEYGEIIKDANPDDFSAETDEAVAADTNSISGLCVGFVGIQTDLNSNVYTEGTTIGFMNALEIMKDGERNMLIYKLGNINQELESHGLTKPTFLAKRSGWLVYERRNSVSGTLQLIVDGPRDFQLSVLNKFDPDVETVMREFVDGAYISNECPITSPESDAEETTDTLCFDRLNVQTDLPLSEYSYINPENLSVVLKNDKEHFIIYPLIPGIDVTKDYDLDTSEFTVEKMGWTVYKDDGRAGGYIVDSPILPFLIFPTDQNASNEVTADIELFLKSSTLAFPCPENSGRKDLSPTDIPQG